MDIRVERLTKDDQREKGRDGGREILTKRDGEREINTDRQID